jgi:hypothetical protein
MFFELAHRKPNDRLSYPARDKSETPFVSFEIGCVNGVHLGEIARRALQRSREGADELLDVAIGSAPDAGG